MEELATQVKALSILGSVCIYESIMNKIEDSVDSGSFRINTERVSSFNGYSTRSKSLQEGSLR